MGKKFFKMSLSYSENGFQIYKQTFVSVHETEMMYFCIETKFKNLFDASTRDGESVIKRCKRMCIKLKRVHKHCSRIAFDTEQKAYEHLLFLKSRQINHLNNELKIITEFLKSVDGKSLEKFKKESFMGTEYINIPGTKESINEIVNFY